MKSERPNPEKLLKRVNEEERELLRGKLKIYLGAAPGVGKTYSMLQDALAKHNQGIDIVIGIVESHGRKEIEALLKDFEILPRQQILYHNQHLSEFDLDAALKRNPGIILVDEMAHTNVPGLRHHKRWQDIKELLDRGINVYTTLNVQHIESLKDIISQIVHTTIKETVPDSMLALADTIELIDLAPEDLLKRLQEGKIYIPKQAELASEHFFRKGNLFALRELALRFTAERVGAQVLLYREGQGIKHIWPTTEKLLVCVSSNPRSAKLIRATYRMARSLNAEWFAIHIDSPQLSFSKEKRNSAIQNLRLAEQLGASTKILSGENRATEIIHFARDLNITKIVIGKRPHSRWRSFILKNLSYQLVRHSGEIDIYMITDEGDEIKPFKAEPAKQKIPKLNYGISVATIMLATLINFFLFPYLHASNLVMIYLVGVTFVTVHGQLGPAILASLLSVLAYDLFFMPPYFSLAVGKISDFYTLVMMLVVTAIINFLAIMPRRQTEASKLAEHHTFYLHTLSQQLASTRGVDKLLETAVRFLADMFDCEVVALLSDNINLVIRAGHRTELVLNDKELSVAQWVYDMGQTAGLGTNTLPFSDAIYVPMLASQGAIGVLRIRPIQPEHLFTPEQMHLLETCANQIALAIEVDKLHEQAKQAELHTFSNRIQGAVLKSVSHDLHAPIATIMGAASTLVEMGKNLDRSKIKELGEKIYFELEQLSRLINNLLQITYLESDSIHLQKKLCSLADVIVLVLDTLKNRLATIKIIVNLPADLPVIPMDMVLIQDVFINLLDNAIKFNKSGFPITIAAVIEKNNVIVSVEDHGPGIVADEVNKLFEKFYRGRLLATERGIGLGLAICKSIIEAHGGKIWAENSETHGAIFKFSLPMG